MKAQVIDFVLRESTFGELDTGIIYQRFIVSTLLRESSEEIPHETHSRIGVKKATETGDSWIALLTENIPESTPEIIGYLPILRVAGQVCHAGWVLFEIEELFKRPLVKSRLEI